LNQTVSEIMEALLVVFLSLLIKVHCVVESVQISMLGELESFDIYKEEKEIWDFGMPSWTTECGGHVLVNIDCIVVVQNEVANDT